MQRMGMVIALKAEKVWIAAERRQDATRRDRQSALSLRSKVLLLDEPTASLTPHENISLFRLLRKLRDDGVGMLFVSQKLAEVQAICDAVTVLRDDRNACESRGMAGLDRQDLVRLMIGRSEQIPDWSTRDHCGAAPVLELEEVASSLGHRDIDVQVRRGEIVVSTASSGRDGRRSPNRSSAFFRSRPERSGSRANPSRSPMSRMRSYGSNAFSGPARWSSHDHHYRCAPGIQRTSPAAL